MLALGDLRGHGMLGCDFHVDCWSRLTVESVKPSAQPGRPSQPAPCMRTTSLAAAYSSLLNIYLGLHFLPLKMYTHVYSPRLPWICFVIRQGICDARVCIRGLPIAYACASPRGHATLKIGHQLEDKRWCSCLTLTGKPWPCVSTHFFKQFWASLF